VSKVSICIPTYNGEEFIKETIESALYQSYENIEIIVNDDASIDKTKEIVLSFNNPKIKYYCNEKNIKACANCNAAVDHASGEYIKFLFQDDILLPNAIEKEVEAFLNNDIVLTISDTILINNKAKKIGMLKHLRQKGVLDGKKVAKKNALWRNYFGAPVNNLFRKDAYINVGGYDEECRSITDMDIASRIACTGKVYNFTECLCMFRVHNKGFTTEAMGDKYHDFIKDHVDMLKRHQQMKLYPLSDFELFWGILMRRIRYRAGQIYMKFILKKRK